MRSIEIVEFGEQLFVKTNEASHNSRDNITLNGVMYVNWETKVSYDGKTYYHLYVTQQEYNRRMAD